MASTAADGRDSPLRRPAARKRVATGDVVAGLTVALVLVPQSLAYAKLAGMPPERGLYASIIPLIVAAPLASSPYLQTGPVAVTAVLTFGALSTIADPGSDRYVALGLLLALVVGVVRLAIGLLRSGVVAYLMSRPMLAGFVPAAATFIAASQLPAALGAKPPDGAILGEAAWTLIHPGAWSLGAVGLLALVMVAVFGGRRLHPLFPGVLLAVTAATLLSMAVDYPGATVGTIDVGAPPISLDLPWGDTLALLVPGAIIALVGFAEPASIARSFAAQERLPWDSNREFVSQGAANLAAGLTGGFPIGGSFSRSALNRMAGAKSAWSGAITGIAVLAVLPIAFLLSPLPTAVLAAIVISAVIPLIRLRPITALWSHSRPATLIAVGTFAATLGFAPRIERGVLVGVGLSVAVHLWRELNVSTETWEEDATLHVRPQGVLWFGAAQALEDRLLAELARRPSIERMMIHLDGVGRLDITAAQTLHTVLDEARRGGVEVDVDGVRPEDRRLVDGVVLAPDKLRE